MIKKFLMGNEAIAQGCLEAGIDFATGYPGTPSSEIITSLSISNERNVYVEWSVNEKVALENAIGAAWCGLRSICVMKHVGLNVAADPFMSLAYTGVKGGFVIIVTDDPFPHSSQNEQDSRRYAHAAKIPCLDPATPQEAKDMVKYAFELSEKYEIPVMLRPTTRICHARSDIEVEKFQIEDLKPTNQRFVKIPKEKRVGRFFKDRDRWVLVPSNAKILHRELQIKQKKIIEDLNGTPFNKRVKNIKETKIAVVSGGVASCYVKELIPNDIPFFKIGTYPVDIDRLGEFTKNYEKILVIEELDPILEEIVKMSTCSTVLGKYTGDVPFYGELNQNIVYDILIKNGITPVVKYDLKKPVEGLPARPPILCAGCPHRSILYLIEKIFKNGIYTSDIGCYTLSPFSVDTCLCMGASITIGSGISHCDKRDVVATIGDSTFMHTGIPGLINAVYNNANILIVILDNRTTAMTGHQPTAGTGQNIQGESKELSLEKICQACGADFVETVDPFDINLSKKILERAKKEKGVRVIIARHPCYMIERKQNVEKAYYEIDVKRCTKCGDCLDYGCPAIELYDIKPIINDLCTGCGVCSDLCRNGAIRRIK
ncbi:MAG: indolepyruvate ferredoxin oxidoreductase subunit alpha [Candidatus Methanoliparum thermophilum]|uniref:Indolepyruvate oxidoreductase subunit IorA n=1 Tax=Methanoliparum thermophilum TaxID=2491083 RepID=A0A520KS91_METT2|nr:MAG: indolepyruvate ferredoxin oxidoreductase subunit alpha [Candidatus Methanoliparum thermophilum]